jgi:hypothetical protein
MLLTRQQLATLPVWPSSLGKREWHKVGRATIPITRAEYQERAAHQRLLDNHNIQNSFTTGTVAELMWNNGADATANASTSSETAMMTGLLDQPTIPALYFYAKPGLRRQIRLHAKGVGSTTSTPTVIGQWRMGTTQGVTQTGGTSIGQNVALACASGAASLLWETVLDCVCTITGMGANNSTLEVSGWIGGPLFSSLQAELVPSSGSPAAWLATFDCSVTQYVVFNWTWSASSSSNTAVLKHGSMIGFN